MTIHCPPFSYNSINIAFRISPDVYTIRDELIVVCFCAAATAAAAASSPPAHKSADEQRLVHLLKIAKIQVMAERRK
jgi:hypothetical protein